MQPCLADINVWLALLVHAHTHHRIARKWFDRLQAGEGGICRTVQLGLLRLLANPSVLGKDALSAIAAWEVVARLMEDERLSFLSEPPHVDTILPELLKYPVPTGKLIPDAYLAAFAMALPCRLVTLDRGFRQFRGLDLNLLA